jgi:hypothetical protein
MEKLDKIVEIKSEKMKVEVDPRSKTSADKAFSGIAVPEEVEVRGTKRMLKEKSKKAKWY